MRITLSDNLRLEGKELAWELQKLRTKHGVSSWQATKYYRRLSHALSEVAERRVRLAPGEGLTDAIRALDTVRQDLQKVLDIALDVSEGRSKESTSGPSDRRNVETNEEGGES